MAKTKNKKMQDIARRMLKQFEQGKHDDGEYFYSFTLEAIREGDACHRILSDIIHDSGSEKYSYKWVHSALESFAECENLEEADIYEYTESEISIYTYDLTEWLGSNAYNMEHLTEAIREGSDDGLRAIQRAQSMAIDEIYNNVRNAIVKIYKLENSKK